MSKEQEQKWSWAKIDADLWTKELTNTDRQVAIFLRALAEPSTTALKRLDNLAAAAGLTPEQVKRALDNLQNWPADSAPFIQSIDGTEIELRPIRGAFTRCHLDWLQSLTEDQLDVLLFLGTQPYGKYQGETIYLCNSRGRGKKKQSIYGACYIQATHGGARAKRLQEIIEELKAYGLVEFVGAWTRPPRVRINLVEANTDALPKCATQTEVAHLEKTTEVAHLDAGGSASEAVEVAHFGAGGSASIPHEVAHQQKEPSEEPFENPSGKESLEEPSRHEEREGEPKAEAREVGPDALGELHKQFPDLIHMDFPDEDNKDIFLTPNDPPPAQSPAPWEMEVGESSLAINHSLITALDRGEVIPLMKQLAAAAQLEPSTMRADLLADQLLALFAGTSVKISDLYSTLMERGLDGITTWAWGVLLSRSFAPLLKEIAMKTSEREEHKRLAADPLQQFKAFVQRGNWLMNAWDHDTLFTEHNFLLPQLFLPFIEIIEALPCCGCKFVLPKVPDDVLRRLVVDYIRLKPQGVVAPVDSDTRARITARMREIESAGTNRTTPQPTPTASTGGPAKPVDLDADIKALIESLPDHIE